jgi:hexulose-6-phosphate isomerase
MQGRLSRPVGERIQAFPAHEWAEEFPRAATAGLQLIEWIYDLEGDDVNPIVNEQGIAKMRELAATHGVAVRSLCADYFMPEPLLQGAPAKRAMRLRKLEWLLAQACKAGMQRVVLPFVDNSKADSDQAQEELAELLKQVLPKAAAQNLEIHLETSLPPDQFARLLRAINHPSLKVNYDSGNSAALGYRVEDEFAAYGEHIGSIHIKDRLRGGGTVPLGEGDADLPMLRRCVSEADYNGDFILQVARSAPGEEVAWARRNLQYVERLFGP